MESLFSFVPFSQSHVMTQNTTELRFQRTQYLALPERAELASALGLTQVLTTYTLKTERTVSSASYSVLHRPQV